MKDLKALILLIICSVLITGCFDDGDDVPITAGEINDFVWKGMNAFYLYKDNTPDLANNRFSTDQDYNAYLNNFSKPEDLFESLIYQRQTVDRFSWIVDDYIALEQLFSGVSTSNGMEFKTFRFSSTDNNIYGFVTHVLPNTDAARQGVKRGDLFYGIDGTQLTMDNRRTLLNQTSYTINLGNYDENGTPDDSSDDSITPGTKSIALTKTEYTENPVFISNVLDVSGTKVAYLMYNGFTGTEQFNADLNSAFGTFKNANATELVLDLRYNPGGSVNTAIMLGSLITGQFFGDVFSTEQWNTELQQAFDNDDPELLINRFVNRNGDTELNSLNLNTVYILTTRSSASASELIINSLIPYINVVQIGSATSGKYQASTTIYDSPNFSRNGANPAHTYAMQPLIFKSLNVDGVTDYFDGLSPNSTNVIFEDISNLGVLGDVNEPLLATALARINGVVKLSTHKKGKSVNIVEDSKDLIPFSKSMYTDKKPLTGL